MRKVNEHTHPAIYKLWLEVWGASESGMSFQFADKKAAAAARILASKMRTWYMQSAEEDAQRIYSSLADQQDYMDIMLENWRPYMVKNVKAHPSQDGVYFFTIARRPTELATLIQSSTPLD